VLTPPNQAVHRSGEEKSRTVTPSFGSLAMRSSAVGSGDGRRRRGESHGQTSWNFRQGLLWAKSSSRRHGRGVLPQADINSFSVDDHSGVLVEGWSLNRKAGGPRARGAKFESWGETVWCWTFE